MKRKNTLLRFAAVLTTIVLWLYVSSVNIQPLMDALRVNAAGSEVVLGDMNGDNVIDIFDLALLKREVQIRDSASINGKTADVNIDGVVDVKDIIEVQDFIHMQIHEFSGNIKKEFQSVDRSLVSNNVSGKPIQGYNIQLTAEMAMVAKNLTTPQAIYNYVANNVNTEFYYGLRKGAIGTYEQNGGNDYDQACLLLSMYNYMGYEATCLDVTAEISSEDLIAMTSANDISSAKAIYTSHGRTLVDLNDGVFQINQVGVFLSYEGESYFLDPSFKQYAKRKNATNLDAIARQIEDEYNVETIDSYYSMLKEVEEKYANYNIAEAFPQYEIIEQDFNVLPYKVSGYSEDLPPADQINLSLGNTKLLSYPSAYLYNHNLTIEYELTDEALFMLDGTGIDSIDDLDQNYGSYNSWFQIYAVIKMDGKEVAHGTSGLLGDKETLHIQVESNGNTIDFNKELTFGALYSIVFDYQIISPQDIAESYSKLPQTVNDRSKFDENNIYGSSWLMDTMNLLGKTYFSQIDTNNKISSEFSHCNYSRDISIAVVDFTPDIYTQSTFTLLNKQGRFGIDVLGNQTYFTSREGDIAAESKLKHSTGYLSSTYESEVLTQFTGLRTVSTAEVLQQASEQGVEILFLSNVNISELTDATINESDKADIAKLIGEGKYVTVPKENITIGNWTGTGYIVHDPKTGENAYVINNGLYGGSLCSWVGLSYLCDILLTVVECVWAYKIITFGATVLAAGLIATAPVSIIAGIVIGMGLIIGGTFYIKDIGDRLYDTTELMNRYVDGDESAGILLQANSVMHGFTVGAFTIVGEASSKYISDVIVDSHLTREVGSYYTNAFANSRYGTAEGLRILNRISPANAKTFEALIRNTGSSGATSIGEIEEKGGISEVDNTLNIVSETTKQAKRLGISEENIAKMNSQIIEASAKGAKFTEPTLQHGGLPRGNYEQINPNDAIENIKALQAQNNAADILAKNGYDIEMLPNKIEGNGYGVIPTGSPDYLIDGEPFDCFSPSTAPPRNVASTVEKKTLSQARRIVLNLNNYTAGSVDDIASQFVTWNLSSLDELLVIIDEEIVRIVIK